MYYTYDGNISIGQGKECHLKCLQVQGDAFPRVKLVKHVEVLVVSDKKCICHLISCKNVVMLI